MVTRDLELSARKGIGWPGLAAASILAVLYIAVILNAETEFAIIGLIAVLVVVVGVAAKLGWVTSARESLGQRQSAVDIATVLSFLFLTAICYNNTFVLFLISSGLSYV